MSRIYRYIYRHGSPVLTAMSAAPQLLPIAQGQRAKVYAISTLITFGVMVVVAIVSGVFYGFLDAYRDARGLPAVPNCVRAERLDRFLSWPLPDPYRKPTTGVVDDH